MKSTADFLEPWYQALDAEFGIVLETNMRDVAKGKLYAARKEADDPELAGLSIVVSPTSPESQLWIVKRKVDDNEI